MKEFLRRYSQLLIGGAALLVLVGAFVAMQITAATHQKAEAPRPTVTLFPSLTWTPAWTPSLTASPTKALTNTPSQTPTTSPTCAPALDKIQEVLQTTIPDTYWSVVYAGIGYSKVWFEGVSTGETETRTIQGKSGTSWRLDLAHFYYLQQDGSLASVWGTLGFAQEAGSTPSTTPEPYYSFNDQSKNPLEDVRKAGWYSSQEALARLAVPGEVYNIGFPDSFLTRLGIQWNQCQAMAQAIPKASCDIGPVLDPSGSAEFFSSLPLPENWILFGFDLTPGYLMTYRYPFPSTIPLPEAVCP